MSAANDLLRRALEALEIHGEKITWALIEEIRAYLDAPRKPMTEEEINDLCPFEGKWHIYGYKYGVRHAEKFHGIGGEDE